MTEPSDVKVIRPGRQAKPEIRTETRDGVRYLIKDYSPCGWAFRVTIGWWLVAREYRVFREAEGIQGIPGRGIRPGAWTLGYEYAPGRMCSELDEDELPADFWDDLSRVVGELHKRRIAHGDLKTAENIIVGDDGRVYLVDLTAAIVSRLGPLHALIYRYVQQDDMRALIKVRQMLAPHTVTDEDQAFLRQRSTAEKIFRQARQPLRWIAKRLGGRRSAEGSGRPSVLRRQTDDEGQVRGDASARDRGKT